MACKKKCGGKVTKKQSGGVPKTSGVKGPTVNDNASTRKKKN